MIERIFAGKVLNSDDLIVKYLDSDGDQVTLANDSDLTVALHFHQHLRLFVYINGKETIGKKSKSNTKQDGSLIEAKTFAHELQQIRNSVQTILDRFEIPSQSVNDKREEKRTISVPTPSAAVLSTVSREFDPYTHVIERQRSSTPNSIRSRVYNSKKNAPTEEQTPPVPSGKCH